MKTADLKAGELYAVKYKSDPCLLLSTDIHEEFIGRSVLRYSPAPGEKPRRDRSKSWGFDRRNYGFLVLNGPTEALTGIDASALLAAVIADSRSAVPEGAHLDLVTSPVAILGRYEDHVKAERERQDAADARRRRDAQLRRERIERHNAVVWRLNVHLGTDVIALCPQIEFNEPLAVKLSFAQAERIADPLDSPNPEGKS